MRVTTPTFSALPNEQVLLRSEFSPHLILKHLTVTMILTDQRVYVHEPHTILGFIPHGGHQQSVALDDVSDVYSGDQTSTRRAAIGGGVALMGLYMMIGAGVLGGPLGVLLGLVVMGIGVLVFLTARTVGVVVRTVGGGTLSAPGGGPDRPAADQMHMAVATETQRAHARRRLR